MCGNIERCVFCVPLNEAHFLFGGERMKRRIFAIIGVCLLFMSLLLCLCACPNIFDYDLIEDDNLSSNKIQSVLAPSTKIEYTKGLGYYVTISGALKNISNTKLTYVSITFTLYDKDGYNVGTAMANMNYLDAGGIWKYEAHSLQWFEESPESYKCTDITCF